MGKHHTKRKRSQNQTSHTDTDTTTDTTTNKNDTDVVHKNVFADAMTKQLTPSTKTTTKPITTNPIIPSSVITNTQRSTTTRATIQLQNNNNDNDNSIIVPPPPLDPQCLVLPTTTDDNKKALKSISASIKLLDLARATLTPKKNKKHKRRKEVAVQPTPIQRQAWSLATTGITPSTTTTTTTTTNNTTTNDETCDPSTTPTNVIGIAPTGSGKTLCYAIPIVSSLLQLILQQSQSQSQSHGSTTTQMNGNNYSGGSSGGGVYALIMVPTRELTMQVRDEIKMVITAADKLRRRRRRRRTRKLEKSGGDDDDDDGVKEEEDGGEGGDVGALAIYGGVSRKEQVDALLSSSSSSSSSSIATTDNNGNQNKKMKWWIVVATPGRLLDLLLEHKNQRLANMFTDNVRHVVLDEADRMAGNLDMAIQVDQILGCLNHSMGDATVGGGEGVGTWKKEEDRATTMSLYSATLPQRVWGKWNEWIGFPRVLIEVDSMTVGGAATGGSGAGGIKKIDGNIKRDCDTGDGDGDVTMDTKGPIRTLSDTQTTTTNTSTRNEVTSTTTSSTTTPSTSNEETQTTKQKRIQKERGPLNLSAIPQHVVQTLHVCSNHKKPKKLLATLAKIRQYDRSQSAAATTTTRRNQNRSLTLLFFNRIKTLHYVSSLLHKEMPPSHSTNSTTTTSNTSVYGMLHSQMDQARRDVALANFRSGKCPILLATDIAARGLHVKNVKFVVNYDFPGSLEQYVHRCGRAGRNDISHKDDQTNTNDDGCNNNNTNNSNNNNPTVYSFFNRELAPMAKDVFDLLKSCNAWIDPNLVSLVGDSGGDTAECEYNNGGKKRKRRRRGGVDVDGQPKTNGGGSGSTQGKGYTTTSSKKNNTPNDAGEVKEEEDEFASIGTARIVLQRASHVSDAESDTDED